MTNEERTKFVRETLERYVAGKRISWSPELILKIVERWEQDIEDARIEAKYE